MPYADGVTLITCTGDRPQAFALCNWFVGRQTWSGKLQWIVVNDGVYTNAYADLPKWPRDRIATETRIFPEPKWQPGQNTLARNLLAAIPEVMYDKVLFIEDDDSYAADYVAAMEALLDRASIVGDPTSLYYHVPRRLYRTMKSAGAASLCQTGIRAELLPMLANVCRASPDYIDVRLWRMGAQRRLLTHIGGVVGIKGLPGRPGIGVGHRTDIQRCWTSDPDLSALRSWIGDDISLYREFMR